MVRSLNSIVAVCQNMGIGKDGSLPWPPLRYRASAGGLPHGAGGCAGGLQLPGCNARPHAACGCFGAAHCTLGVVVGGRAGKCRRRWRSRAAAGAMAAGPRGPHRGAPRGSGGASAGSRPSVVSQASRAGAEGLAAGMAGPVQPLFLGSSGSGVMFGFFFS